MTRLRMVFHPPSTRRIVEVFDNRGRLIAAIVPSDSINGIRIMSKHIARYDLDDGKSTNPVVPELSISFRDEEDDK